MVKYFSLLFFLGCFFVQQNNAQLDIIQAIINDAQAVMNAGAQVSSQLLDGIAQATLFLEGEAQDIVGDTMYVANATISIVVQEAKDLGSNAVSCVQDYEPLLVDYAKTNTLFLFGCILDYFTSAYNIIKNIYDDSEKLALMTIYLDQHLNTACPNPLTLEQSFCDLGFVAITTLNATLITYDISFNILQGYLLYQSLYLIPATFPVCVSARSGVVALNAIPVAATLALCTVSNNTVTFRSG